MLTAAKQTVGVLGAGRMGLPIIGHLVRAGFPVLVYDVDPAKKDPVADKGTSFVTDSGDIARQCGTVLVCVGYESNSTASCWATGACSGNCRGARSSRCSARCRRQGIERLHAAAEPHGVDVVDAPVCCGSWAADAGELLSLLGGSEAAVAKFTPVAEAYSADVVRIGDIDAGQVGKAISNLILWACLVANHEGLALAQRFGVDIDKLRPALQMSSAANHALGNWGDQTMAWAEDDMKIVQEQEMAVEVGISLPQSALNREICRVLKPRRYQVDKYGA